MANPLESLHLEFLRAVLRPLVRFCVRNALTLQHFIDVLKPLFLDAAVEELKRGDQTITASRLTLLTGVHRKDVAKMWARNEEPVRRAPPLLTRVLGQWEQDTRFQTAGGKPRTLALDGGRGSFQDLVKTVSEDINPRSVLEELTRRGLIKSSPHGVRLMRQIHRVGEDPKDRYELLGKNVESLILAGEENLFSPQAEYNVHLRTEYDNVFVEDVPELRRWLMKQSKAFHKKLREYISRRDRDVVGPEKRKGDVAGASVVVSTFSLTSREYEGES